MENARQPANAPETNGTSRRDFIKQGASVAALSAAGLAAMGTSTAAAKPGVVTTAPITTVNSSSSSPRVLPYPQLQWPEEVQESAQTPRLCQWFSRQFPASTVARWRQVGVTGALITNPPGMPWQVNTLLQDRDRADAAGMHITAYLISVANSIVRNTAGRDTAINNIRQSLINAGQAGVRVVEYNFYVHRLTEAYYELIDDTDRPGAGYTAATYNGVTPRSGGVPVKDLPPGNIPLFTKEELWENYEYFLNAVIPVAEEAGVRMAVHPNDPPAPISRGNPQIVASVEDWRRLVETVDSPANGMTVHAGVTPEVGHDAVEFLRYMGSKDRVNHIHFRNVVIWEPFEEYAEVFPDNGETDMFAFIRELVRQGYDRGVLAEHPRAIDFDRGIPGSITGQYADVGGGGHGGELFDTGYARALIQAALLVERGRHLSFGDVGELVDHYYAAGKLSRNQQIQMKAHLTVGDRLSEESESAVDRFAGIAASVADEDVRLTLTSLADQLKADLPE